MTATVNDQSITITDESLTVSESVGIYECDFTFDASWGTWNKTAVFEGAGATIEMIVVDNKAQIPWEVLKEAGWIKIGVYGTKDGEVKPTIWSDQIYVAAGTVPGSVIVTPTPSIYAQILDLANDAKDIAEDAQDTADDVASDWASVSATATTLSAGSPATATFSDNTFAFGIPKGAKGDTGATGATGATPDFSIGTVSTLETGQSATATITGTAAAPVLNLGLPKGNKGDNGDVANIADAYSTSVTYAVGDYCTKDGVLKRCNTAITTAEAWNSAHWDDAKLGGDVSTLRSAIDAVIIEHETVDLSTATVRIGIITQNNLWSTTSGFRSFGIPVDGQHSVSVTANDNNNTSVGLLKNSALASQQTPPFCDGITSRILVQTGATMEITIPSDCTYIVIMKEYSGNDCTPASVVFGSYKTIPDVDDTLTISGDSADAKATGDKINTIIDAITETEIFDIGSATTIRGLINSSKQWSTSSGYYSYAFNITSEYYALSVTASTENNAVVGLLKNSALVNKQTPPFCDGITDRIIVPVGTTMEIPIPSDCTYIVITKETASVDYTPTSVALKKWGISSAESLPLGLHEMPYSEGVLNIVKRCRQMTDIEWTPASDLKRLMIVQRELPAPDTSEAEYYLGTFKAGVKYKGIPYGRVNVTVDEYGYDYGTVGNYIDFETFISSVSNPKSRACKENVGSVASHRSIIYATVCSGFTCYALNVTEVATSGIPSISGLTSIGKINNSGTLLADNLIKIGDILNKANYHTAIITDIIRDTDGTIQKVEISEATVSGLADRNHSDGLIGGVCRRKGWSRELFFKEGWWGDYTLYRYTGASEIPYTPNPYVNVGDEFDDFNIEQFPVMPYEGNAFKYIVGHIPNNAVKLVITLSGYEYLKVFKNGVEITGSPFAVTSESDVINDINISEITAGEYEAYLCNISDGNVINLTYPCKWTIEA